MRMQPKRHSGPKSQVQPGRAAGSRLKPGPMGPGRRGLLCAALAVASLWSWPAGAMMPPYVYEAARNDAASVIVVRVETVTPPRRAFGNCVVTGTVAKVERGTAYQDGQAVSLEVPCQRKDATPPIGGTIYQPVDTLTASRFGRAYLDASGKVVLSQYQQLDALP